jgi:hypothetical protein
MEYIYPHPYTRINETWIDSSVACVPLMGSVLHPLIHGKPNSPTTRYQADFYKYVAVDIVSESVYNYRYPYISEKILRPIACKRLFIVVGAPGTLALLHSKGFNTFPNIFDESYDSIFSPVQRWHALEKVIKDFVTKPLEEIIRIVQSSSAILDHNFEVLKNLQKIELKDLVDTH